MKKNSEGFTIGDLIDIFLPKIWFIVIIAMVFGFALGAYSLFIKDDTYTSEITFDIPIGYVNINLSELEYSQKLVDKYKEIIKLKTFAKDVYSRIRVDEMYLSNFGDTSVDGRLMDLIIASLSFQQRGETTLFTIKVTTSDSKLSWIIAKHVRDALTDSKDKDELDVVSQPEEPIHANSKNEIRNTLIGVIIGAVLSMAVVFVASILDITVRDRKKLEESFDYPVLGVIPRYDVEPEREEA